MNCQFTKEELQMLHKLCVTKLEHLAVANKYRTSEYYKLQDTNDYIERLLNEIEREKGK